MSTPVIAIIDIGKTNKKLFLFNQQYQVVHETSKRLAEVTDEDGDACEDIEALKNFIIQSIRQVILNPAFDVRAINFSAYGASFVYINEYGDPVAPLYNYLKTFPAYLHQKFYSKYGGEEKLSLQTASPVLGSLNSGMQVYRLKYANSVKYDKVEFALHLPQFAAFLCSRIPFSEKTSLGCHTNLWNFNTNSYHEWVHREGIINKLPPLIPSNNSTQVDVFGKQVYCGVGLHDSSAALIPYLMSATEPFVLISTGTWCISLNPFNQHPLTEDELQQDCLCYLTFEGKPVKASRLFAGQLHEDQVKRIAAHFKVAEDFFMSVRFSAELVSQLQAEESNCKDDVNPTSNFAGRDLQMFIDAETAYHRLMMDIANLQFISTSLVLNNTPAICIYVDGGFSNNELYMHLLASKFAGIQVFAANVPQATALGAALSIHHCWNSQPAPGNLLQSKSYSKA